MEELGLRAFADTGSAEEDEPPARDDGRGAWGTLGSGSLEPGGAVGLRSHGSLGAAVSSGTRGPWFQW